MHSIWSLPKIKQRGNQLWTIWSTRILWASVRRPFCRCVASCLCKWVCLKALFTFLVIGLKCPVETDSPSSDLWPQLWWRLYPSGCALGLSSTLPSPKPSLKTFQLRTFSQRMPSSAQNSCSPPSCFWSSAFWWALLPTRASWWALQRDCASFCRRRMMTSLSNPQAHLVGYCSLLSEFSWASKFPSQSNFFSSLTEAFLCRFLLFCYPSLSSTSWLATFMTKCTFFATLIGASSFQSLWLVV